MSETSTSSGNHDEIADFSIAVLQCLVNSNTLEIRLISFYTRNLTTSFTHSTKDGSGGGTIKGLGNGGNMVYIRHDVL